MHWTQPGSVWAVDFHGPRPLLDGLYPYLLAIRDLASGYQLLWQPVADARCPTVREALAALFLDHGAPLVLKSDNGSAFVAEDLRNLMDEFRVKMLFSPARTPRYNGAIEAGIGSLKSRTEQHARRHDRQGCWTCDDAESARLEANATSRPKGPLGPSPDQLWQERPLIAPAQRHRFSITVAQALEKFQATEPTVNLMDERAIQRDAVRLALVEHGFLFTTRRSIPLPFPAPKAADIT